ncbi:hypothetical protein ABZX83_11280 [Streptomyces thermoviolaceus]|uniref:hypothetical protein n=1 Tax=Streptomyces thermoviolaceus TaxID=1952 RepID=UPI0033AB5227
MHSDKEPSRSSGLSTEDLLRERSGGPASRSAPPQTDAPPPVYPGESTGEAPPRRSGTGEPSGTRESSGTREPSETREPSGTREPPETREPSAAGDRAAAAPAASGAPSAEPETQPQDTPRSPDAGQAATAEEESPRLLSPEDEQGFRDRWKEAQSRFVDDPREAVHTADTLVAEVMQTLAATFAQHKQELESQWSQGEQADTEALRRALRRYRSFFNRLLST